MKISKVDHARTAVGKKEQETRGIVYTCPQREEESFDLEHHVQRRNQQAQRMYAVLLAKNQTTKNKTEKMFSNQVIRYFNRMICTLIKKEQPVEGKLRFLEILRSWELFQDKGQEKKLSIEQLPLTKMAASYQLDVEQVTGVIVDECLKNSLRVREASVYIPDVMKKLLVAFCSGPDYLRMLREIPTEEKRALLVVLEKDYRKAEQIPLIVKSIDHQCVKVQGKIEGDTCLLQLSSAEKKKKRYIFEFIKKYAEVEEDERQELLCGFRRLLLLFYCGEDVYQASFIRENGVTAWSFGDLRPSKEENFSERVIELLQEKKQADINRSRAIQDQIRLVIKEELRTRYLRCKNVDGIDEMALFWLVYIEEHTEQVLTEKSNLKPKKLLISYLCDHTWKAWLSYIAMKYVDMGKAVYHFVLPEAGSFHGEEEICIRDVRETFRDGITSFDYERIKAQETLEREISIDVSFAVNNFARAICLSETLQKRGKEDVLLCDLKLRKDAKKRIFRFFGGISQWKEAEFYEERQLIDACRQALSTIRNSTYHYAGALEEQNYVPDQILERLFQKEHLEVADMYRRRYCSNNVPYFYEEEAVCHMMSYIYNVSIDQRPSQLPTFERLINKSNMMEFMEQFVDPDSLSKIQEISREGVMEQFKASLYFVLKEIYYYGFIQDQNALERFQTAVSQHPAKKEEERATKDFQRRISVLIQEEHMTLGGLCQQIMTDYNMQNQGKKEVRLSKSENEEIYQHYRMLLYVCMKRSFLEYLKEKEDVFGFLRIPEFREVKIEEQKLYKQSQICIYGSMEIRMKQQPDLYAWYVFAHFLNPRYLNLLIGSIKSYIQYIEDIDRRAKSTGNRTDCRIADKTQKYQEILQVLKFCGLFCGNVTKVWTDYFDKEEDYAKSLSGFVDFAQEQISDAEALKEFCARSVDKGRTDQKIGIYYDAMNPVVNKNMVRAMMYGNVELLSACVEKVTETEIQEYHQREHELQEVFQRGSCSSEEEQRGLRKFQNQKNRIELVDVMVYSQILNDLVGQLVSWSYLRERDLMYFQLGIHYCRLFYSDKIEEGHRFRVLNGDHIHIREGALLYQIAAMYTYVLPVYDIDADGKAVLPKKKGNSTGVSITAFYHGYCQKDASVYETGLCLFENLKEHKEIVNTRDYIDHSKYFSTMNRSILELYSEVFDRFFTYDTKLKKSVSYILKNMLSRYAVIVDTSLDSCAEKTYRTDQKQITKKAAHIGIGSNGLKSDVFQYRITDGKTVRIAVRDEIFLRQLKRILEYKKC